MLIDVNTLVKKPIEHNTFCKKRNKIKYPTKILICNLQQNKIYKSYGNINTRHKSSLNKS